MPTTSRVVRGATRATLVLVLGAAVATVALFAGKAAGTRLTVETRPRPAPVPEEHSPPPVAPDREPTTSTTTPAAPSADPPSKSGGPVSGGPTSRPGVLERGDRGPSVVGLQKALDDLGYWLGSPDGTFGDLTSQAVMAFQKVEGLTPDGIAGPTTQGRLEVATRPAVAAGDDRVEIDLSRQVLFVIRDGAVRWTINTSTGRDGLETPPGHFIIEREVDGLRHAPLGDLYRPKYFHRGYAVHGSSSVPARPASHGCARVSYAAMDLLWSRGLAVVGSEVWVY
jgi:hypothetical protein